MPGVFLPRILPGVSLGGLPFLKCLSTLFVTSFERRLSGFGFGYDLRELGWGGDRPSEAMELHIRSNHVRMLHESPTAEDEHGP